MMQGIIGEKMGMTRLYGADHRIRAVTVIRVRPNRVLQAKTEQTDGYAAVQLGMGMRKVRNVPRALLGHVRKAGPGPVPWAIRELPADNPIEHKAGDTVTVSIFAENDLVDVQGLTKGRGYAGVVKRWDFGGGPRTHGQSDRTRAPGAIGSQRPQRVIKGTKMAGHYGAETVTMKNLRVIRVDQEKNLLLVHGAVPGPKNAILLIRKTGRSAAPIAEQKPTAAKKAKK